MTITTTEPCAAELAGHQGFSIISNEKLRQLSLSMVKGRMVEECLAVLARQGKLDAAAGHEAAAVGVVAALLPEDAIAASPGNLLVRFLQNELQGKPLDQLLVHAADPDSADPLQAALRAAKANKNAGNGKVAVVFSSKDAGFPDKALQQASAECFPILFVSPTSVLSEPMTGRSNCVPIMPVDGSDVVAVFRVAIESITHARKGNGPTLIECYFDPSEAHDPILKMEDYLTRKGLFREEWKREAALEFTRELEALIQAVRP